MLEEANNFLLEVLQAPDPQATLAENWERVDDAFMHVLEIPLFFTGLLFDSIISLGKPRYSFGKLRGFTVNVCRLIGFAPRILANKPYFYKVL